MVKTTQNAQMLTHNCTQMKYKICSCPYFCDLPKDSHVKKIKIQATLVCSVYGGLMTGNLGTRFPRNLHPQLKYFLEVPLFDKICIDMNIFDQTGMK